MKALYLLRFSPSEIGHGGHHRAYQIMHDLVEALGEANIFTFEPQINFDVLSSNPQVDGRLTEIFQKIQLRYRLLRDYVAATGTPYRLLPRMLALLLGKLIL